MYIMNCTSDPTICSQLHVIGFPTLIAFRGYGEIGSEHCVTPGQATQLIRMDYHGVLEVRLDWCPTYLYIHVSLICGCVRLAFVCRPRGAHSSPWQELIERSLTLSWWSRAPRSSQSDPFHKQGTWGWPGWAPRMTSKLFEWTRGWSGSTQGS